MSVEKSEAQGQAHRPGLFKQTNKLHKHGRHRSKGSISIATKGKVSVKTLSKKNKRELNREERRHQAFQIRQNKRDEVLSKKRSLGGPQFAPFLICILPLNKQLDVGTAVGILTQCDPEAKIIKSSTGVTHINCPRLKQNFSFVLPSLDTFAILDTLKVCDTVLFIMSAATGEDDYCLIDEWGENMMNLASCQSMPTPVVALTDLDSILLKKRNDHKQYIQKMINKWLPNEKIMPLGSEIDGLNILRKIGKQKKKPVLYRDRRPHLYAENIEFISGETEKMGTLKVTGYLRGSELCVNSLIHIPGLGDFQMSQIDRNESNKMDEDTIRILAKSDPSKQESLDSENIPDPMNAEQTWPTQEEIEMAEEKTKLKKVKKVPSGWSAYQAAWIPDDDAEFLKYESDDSNDDDNDNKMDAKSDEDSNNEEAMEDCDTVTESDIEINNDKYDQTIDLQNEKLELEKLKEAMNDRIFPDEIDTPLDQSARERFQKYRGLESFRTSPWDPKENLPSDYARIFQFKNFDHTRKRIIKSQQNDKIGATPGWYITVHIMNVSEFLWENFKKSASPLVLIGLFPHEHKMSLVNVILKRTSNYSLPIKSKEKLIFQCGYRRFTVNPIFSQHTNGSKYKFEKFFHSDTTVVATFYAPIQFPPAPILCFKEVEGNLIFIASGNLLSCNPDRIILKRITLSGHPFKIFKKSSVIRFMFFNRDDIIYFKPCKLRTKLGRVGHIKEPLGTHGHMKCVFDGHLKSQDTVLLHLYKRIFPKWCYEDLIVSSNSNMET